MWALAGLRWRPQVAIAVPDEAMADSKYHHADQIIRKLADFDLAAYGLPPRP